MSRIVESLPPAERLLELLNAAEVARQRFDDAAVPERPNPVSLEMTGLALSEATLELCHYFTGNLRRLDAILGALEVAPMT